MKSTAKFLFLICMIFLLFACKTQKKIIETEEPLKIGKIHKEPEAVFHTRHSFITLKVKRMNFTLEINGIEDTFKGNMAIQRDSLIVISIIPMLGYEAMRIMCTKDSLIVINRTDKTYHSSSIDFLMDKYHMSQGFNGLQAVLTNEAFMYKSEYPDIDYKSEVKKDKGNLLYLREALLGGVTMGRQKITADSTRQNISDMTVFDYQHNFGLSVWYSDFNIYRNSYFPERVRIELKDSRNSINLDIAYGLIIFDDPINVKFEVPDSYDRIYM